MSYPSDYRYLPFSDTPNYVSKTEYYQIPATSPYEVRLNEVPEKASPSTMTIKVVTGWSGGSPVYGATMTEVSATPASGEYYPDYYTEADGDSNWNTGTIQFNSANANTTIEVTYMATGGLASIKSNHYPSWMTDRGDGSDGVFAPTSNTTIAGGEKNYTIVKIPAGVTVTFSTSAWIKCQGFFINEGTITVTPSGGAGGAGGGNTGNGKQGGVGIGGGNGGAGAGQAGGIVIPITVPKLPICITGSGGGGANYTGDRWAQAGANGGGGLGVVAKTIVSNVINCNGASASSVSTDPCGGGGGGGGIILVANTVTQGTLNVQGGSGGTGSPSGSNGTAGKTYVKELGNA